MQIAYFSINQYCYCLDRQTNLAPVAQEYTARVAYCIPILVNAAKCFDVSIQQTPEMQTEAAFVELNQCEFVSGFVSTFSAALGL